MMLDSGSTVSLLLQDWLKRDEPTILHRDNSGNYNGVRLETASGDPLPTLEQIQANVKLGELDIVHQFFVVDKLVSPIILGTDFLTQHALVLDFSEVPVRITVGHTGVNKPSQEHTDGIHPIWESERKVRPNSYTVALVVDDPSTADMIDECSIPSFKELSCFEFPETKQPMFQGVLQQYKDLFRGTPGLTDSTYHYIPTTGTPTKVPPRRIPIHYKKEVEQQIQDMLSQGIIEESKSPGWHRLYL